MRTPWLDDSPVANGQSVKENFAQWFGGSKVVGPDGNPVPMFHATYRDFNGFCASESDWTRRKPMDIFYFSSESNAATAYAGGLGTIVVPVFLSAKNPFDPDNQKHLSLLPDSVSESIEMGEGCWSVMEKKKILKAIKKAGFDAMHVNDETGKSLAVFNPSQIKSALGNSGLYLSDSASLTDTQAALELGRALIARNTLITLINLNNKEQHRANALA